MDLLTPGTGLFFWQFIIFVGLIFLLGKLAWKPILSSLKERDASIQEALDSAEKVKLEISNMKADNEKLLRETRAERDGILRDARDAANRIHEQAQAEAKKSADKLIEDARAVINTEKASALRDVRAQVASFSIEIAEKLLKKNLAGDAAQKELIDGYMKDLKVN